MVIMSPASKIHESLFSFVLKLLSLYVEHKRLGSVWGSRTLVKLDAKEQYEPDILFVAQEREHIIGDEKIFGAPDLVIEIVSPGSRRYDYGVKKENYEQAGVREYWLIDQSRRYVEFNQLREGKFTPAALANDHIFHSEVIPGFWIDTNWLWSAPGKFPDVIGILRKFGII
jgi:Uma2 family endonuclease